MKDPIDEQMPWLFYSGIDSLATLRLVTLIRRPKTWESEWFSSIVKTDPGFVEWRDQYLDVSPEGSFPRVSTLE